MMLRKTNPTVRSAFTLMEMLVVVAILVVLASVGGFYYMRSLDDAKRDAAKAQTKVLEDACRAYEFRHGDKPPSLATLTQPDDTGRPFLDDPTKINDPWGRPFQYNPSGPNNRGLKPDIWTTSPQGLQIGNWPGGAR